MAAISRKVLNDLVYSLTAQNVHSVCKFSQCPRSEKCPDERGSRLFEFLAVFERFVFQSEDATRGPFLQSAVDNVAEAEM
jgi:hypothetical protein